jgi:hypothetical protein
VRNFDEQPWGISVSGVNLAGSPRVGWSSHLPDEMSWLIGWMSVRMKRIEGFDQSVEPLD